LLLATVARLAFNHSRLLALFPLRFLSVRTATVHVFFPNERSENNDEEGTRRSSRTPCSIIMMMEHATRAIIQADGWCGGTFLTNEAIIKQPVLLPFSASRTFQLPVEDSKLEDQHLACAMSALIHKLGESLDSWTGIEGSLGVRYDMVGSPSRRTMCERVEDE